MRHAVRAKRSVGAAQTRGTQMSSVNSAIIGNPKSYTPMGIEPWSADFPDGEAIINLGIYPGTPNFPGNFSHFGVKSFVPEFNQAAAALGAQRVKDYQQLDYNLMSKEAVYAPLFNPRWYDFVSARVGGYVYSEAMDAINYNTLYVKS